MTPRLTVRHAGRAQIVARRALRYADGGSAATGRPPHVRAASGLAWQTRDGRRVLVAPQDDTSFLAVLAPPDGPVEALTLDYAPGGRRVFEKRSGTKHQKLDLESIAAIDETSALIFGSGSHENRRRIAWLTPERVSLIEGTELYAGLAAREGFAGSELNVEGAARLGDRLWLSNRGNGAPRGALAPVDAIGALPLPGLMAYLDQRGPAPTLEEILPMALGTIDGGRLGITDLTPGPDGALWFLACAERSPNAYDDGEVVAAAVGRIDLAARDAVLAPLVDEQGAPSRDKPEGLALIAASSTAPARAYACVDADDPDAPSLLFTLEVTGLT